MDIAKLSSSLKLHDDGIWYSLDVEAVSYPSSGNADFFQIEDNSFWFKHRNDCIAATLHNFPPPGAFFDIGGGNGYVARHLANCGYEVVVVEPGAEGAANAKRRGINDVICASVHRAGLKYGSVPAMGLFDVLEHIEEDEEFLRELRKLLIPGGMVYVTVPAYRFLWSGEDVQAGHFRRYTLNTLAQALSNTGFEVVFATYFFRFLPVPIFLKRSVPFRMGIKESKEKAISNDHSSPAGAVGRVLDKLTRSERIRIQEKQSMNFGSSCLVVAQLPESAGVE